MFPPRVCANCSQSSQPALPDKPPTSSFSTPGHYFSPIFLPSHISLHHEFRKFSVPFLSPIGHHHLPQAFLSIPLWLSTKNWRLAFARIPTVTRVILRLPILDVNDTHLSGYSAPSLDLPGNQTHLLLTTLWATHLTRCNLEIWSLLLQLQSKLIGHPWSETYARGIKIFCGKIYSEGVFHYSPEHGRIVLRYTSFRHGTNINLYSLNPACLALIWKLFPWKRKSFTNRFGTLAP